MPKPIFLTPEQAAALLQVSARTVKNMLTSGELPGRRVRDRWRVDRAGFERYIGRELTDEELASSNSDDD